MLAAILHTSEPLLAQDSGGLRYATTHRMTRGRWSRSSRPLDPSTHAAFYSLTITSLSVWPCYRRGAARNSDMDGIHFAAGLAFPLFGPLMTFCIEI